MDMKEPGYEEMATVEEEEGGSRRQRSSSVGMFSRRSMRLGELVSVVMLRLLAKCGIERTTFGRWHEVQAENEETTAGDGSTVYVVPLSVCSDVASIRLLRTSL